MNRIKEEDLSHLAVILRERLTNDQDGLTLYRSLSSSDVAPTIWNRQASFFSKILTKWSQETHIIEFIPNDILDPLVWNTYYPNLIPALTSLLKDKTISKKSDYIEKRSFLGRLTHSLFSLGSPNVSMTETYVFRKNIDIDVKQIIDEILENAAFPYELCFTEAEVLEKGLKYQLPKEIIFKVLENSGDCVYYKSLGFYFKSKRYDNEISLSTIQELLKTKNVVQDIELKINTMNNQIQKLEDKVRTLMRQNKKNEAKKLFIQMKKMQASVEKLQNIQNNFNLQLSTAEDTFIGQSVVNPMYSKMNELMKPEITPEAIDELLDKVQDSVDEAHQVFEAFRPINIQSNLNDEELEDELDALVRESELIEEQEPQIAQNVFTNVRKQPTQPAQETPSTFVNPLYMKTNPVSDN